MIPPRASSVRESIRHSGGKFAAASGKVSNLPAEYRVLFAVALCAGNYFQPVEHRHPHVSRDRRECVRALGRCTAETCVRA